MSKHFIMHNLCKILNQMLNTAKIAELCQQVYTHYLRKRYQNLY